MLKKLLEEAPAAVTAPAPAQPESVKAERNAAQQGYSREHPVPAMFKSATRLNGEGSEKDTHHVVFDISNAGIAYEPGDSLGLMPANDPVLVEQVLAAMKAPADFPVGGKTFREALINDYSLGLAPDMLFELASYIVGGARRQKLKALAKGQDPDGDAATYDVLKVLEAFGPMHPDPEAFLECLEPLQPRLYSISSSPLASPGEVHLTVDAVRYTLDARDRLGVASTFVADRAAPGAEVSVYIQKAHGFTLPADPATPIIMVGPGTGVAPFRAFLWHRFAQKASGKAWLFFGHQREASDFYYRDEFEGMLQSGAMTTLTTAWSRDGADKVYVQNRMREAGSDLWSWLKSGAHFYVCGDAKRMAKDVEAAVSEIAEVHGHMSSGGRQGLCCGVEGSGPLSSGRLLMADGSQPTLASVRTTCPYCGVGCGVKALADGLGGATVAGDPDHPSNFGRLCSKGSALGETLGLATRLLYPEIAGARVTWDQALDHVAAELMRIRDRYGPELIAFYLSGQLLTEDYYVANKLAKGFIGTPHVDTNSRLCMASSVAGHKRAFGADVVPGCYEDLDEAELVVLVGSNTAWCHPILYQRIQKQRQARGCKVVNIDPRQTATTEGADLQLSLASGSDTCLWNGLLVWLFDRDLIDIDYISAHTEGFESPWRSRALMPVRLQAWRFKLVLRPMTSGHSSNYGARPRGSSAAFRRA